jgi:hypothetical protein
MNTSIATANSGPVWYPPNSRAPIRPLSAGRWLVVLILICGFSRVGALDFTQKPFELGTAFSYSAGLVTPWMKAYQAPGIEIAARILGMSEIEAFILAGDSLSIVGAEARVSPQMGAWLPFVGIGYFYARVGSGALDENHATFFSGGLLRFSLQYLATVSTTIFNLQTAHRPYVSFLEFRFGPFFGPGARWILNTGNMLAELDIVKIGIFF